MGGPVLGVRVDVNEELKFLLKCKKKVRGEGGSGRGTRCQLVAGLGVGGGVRYG